MHNSNASRTFAARPWEALRGLDGAIGQIDANLVWALATDFRDFKREPSDQLEALPVIVELGDKATALDLHQELTAQVSGKVCAAYLEPSVSTHFVTAKFSPEYCKGVLTGKVGRSIIKRFELQMPVLPQRAQPLRRGASQPGEGGTGPTSETKVMLGVIDTSCAFAHANLRDSKGSGTRLLRIWDQDGEPAFATLKDKDAYAPKDFGYGCEAPQGVLNLLMSEVAKVSGVIDEDLCYELAGDERLRFGYSHGTAVMDLMAGPRKLGARLTETTKGRTTPPASPGQRTDDDAAKADIVFVQLPRDAVQDSSGGGLSRYVLDGLRYIVSCAGGKTERIVINLSMGLDRGTHDGDSIIEQAMLELVKQCKPNLEIVVAAGNARDQERHAQFDGFKKREPQRVVLRVPPGSETPFFVNVVLPDIGDVEIRLTPPGCEPQDENFVKTGEAKGWPSATAPVCGIVNPPKPLGRRVNRSALIALAPTSSFDPAVPVAPSGDWQIELRANGEITQPVHLYALRTYPSGGALRRAFQARFIDVNETYDPERYLRSRQDDPSTALESPIRRAGTLSSLATLEPGKGVYVAGSYRWRERDPTLHSSRGAGVALPTGQTLRAEPDALAVADQSRALRGICAAGSRSGHRVRVAGTSFAAPQVARERASSSSLSSTQEVPPPGLPGHGGNLLDP